MRIKSFASPQITATWSHAPPRALLFLTQRFIVAAASTGQPRRHLPQRSALSKGVRNHDIGVIAHMTMAVAAGRIVVKPARAFKSPTFTRADLLLFMRINLTRTANSSFVYTKTIEMEIHPGRIHLRLKRGGEYWQQKSSR
jgi:hypothetical protein